MRRAAVTLATILLIFAGQGTASAHTGSGPATPSNMSEHPWSTDGCSQVPDAGTAQSGLIKGPFDFHHACVHHDGCYRHHDGTRLSCDDRFLQNMIASCEEIRSNIACRDRANIYYLGVRWFGHVAWENYSTDAPMDGAMT